MKLILTTLLVAGSAHAGLPLICHPIEIGTVKSLPWSTAKGWDAAEPGYDRSHLVADTLALLTPATPVAARMETMRRAAIYARKVEGLGEELAARLMARVLDASVSGKPEATAWFDAGYFAETRRQLTIMERKNAGPPMGKNWVQHAVRLGGKGMEAAMARMAD